MTSDAFPAAYSIEHLRDVNPSSEPLWRIPKSERPRDGILLRIIPESENPWRAMVEFGRGDLTGVWPLPSPIRALVVSKGNAYALHVDSPGEYDSLDIDSALEVVSASDVGLLLILERTGVTAIGAEGLSWKNYGLTGNDLRDIALDGHFLRGLAWDPAREEYVPFSIDLTSGVHTGGKSRLYPA